VILSRRLFTWVWKIPKQREKEEEEEWSKGRGRKEGKEGRREEGRKSQNTPSLLNPYWENDQFLLIPHYLFRPPSCWHTFSLTGYFIDFLGLP
jgi:hypothetical protein